MRLRTCYGLTLEMVLLIAYFNQEMAYGELC